MQFKQMVCFPADQIDEVDLNRIAENSTDSSASSEEEVCCGDT
jgi:hypothetical protein